MVGNLLTTVGRKRAVIFVTHNPGKGRHNIHLYNFFPPRAWWTAQELLIDRRLPIPGFLDSILYRSMIV